MKFALLSIFVVFFFMEMRSASPIEPVEEEGPVLHRFRRFTCDALSFEVGSVKVNHAACALHCVQLGKRGGYCNGQAVCVCRR